jgi:hypothetical protein
MGCVDCSENQYLNEMLDVGSAITVKTLVPLSCYFWGILTVTAPAGYHVVGTDCLARHLYFNMVEVATLCMQLVSDWLCYLSTNEPFRLKSGSCVLVSVWLYSRVACVRFHPSRLSRS